MGGLFLGLMFLVVGNYLPKCKQTYTVGIRLPWTLADEDNWAYTHRLAGKVWTIGGLVILALTFLRLPALQFVVILVLVLIPTAASFLYARRRETK